jgi:hypothetical protein
LLLAAMFDIDLSDWLRTTIGARNPLARWGLPIVIGMGITFAPIAAGIAQTMQLRGIDSRTTARVWIDASIQPGATVAIESYSPFVDPAKFHVMSVERGIDHEPAWYVDNGCDYLVLSDLMFKRYFENRKNYAIEADAYTHLGRSFPLVKRFTDGGVGIYIYRTVPPDRDITIDRP